MRVLAYVLGLVRWPWLPRRQQPADVHYARLSEVNSSAWDLGSRGPILGFVQRMALKRRQPVVLVHFEGRELARVEPDGSIEVLDLDDFEADVAG